MFMKEPNNLSGTESARKKVKGFVSVLLSSVLRFWCLKSLKQQLAVFRYGVDGQYS